MSSKESIALQSIQNNLKTEGHLKNQNVQLLRLVKKYLKMKITPKSWYLHIKLDYKL